MSLWDTRPCRDSPVARKDNGPREDAFYVDKNDADNDDKGGDIW